jgi:hypothetical protein
MLRIAGLVRKREVSGGAGGRAVRGGGGDSRAGRLERLSVYLTERASRALGLAADLTGDSRTDTVNRAIQVYASLVLLAARDDVMPGGGAPHGYGGGRG